MHIWADFGHLRATKIAGLAGQQISWAEINAYDAANFCGLSAWDKRLIRRLDDAFETARPEVAAKNPKPPSVAEMKASLRASIAAREAKAGTREAKP